MGLLHLESQLAFYGAYHHNALNKLIHIVFVPTIFWTVLVWLSLIPIIPLIPVNFAYIVAISYAAYYVLLEPVAGTLYFPLLLSLAFSAIRFSAIEPQAATIALAIQVISWIMQFIGHGVFEKRAPALLDSLSQAFLLAPFFVFLEVLFFFGYRPSLRERLDKIVEKEIAAFKLSKTKKSK